MKKTQVRAERPGEGEGEGEGGGKHPIVGIIAAGRDKYRLNHRRLSFIMVCTV